VTIRSESDDHDGGDRKQYHVSASKLAALFGKNRSTITDWIRDNCPTVKEGGNGAATLLDPADVLAWREEKSAKRAKKGRVDSGGDATGTMDVADLLKIEQIRSARLQMALKAKILVHRDPIEMAVRQANGLFRQTLMSQPESVAKICAGRVDKQTLAEIHEATWNACASALEAWQDEISKSMQKLAEQAMTFDDDDDEFGLGLGDGAPDGE